MDCGRYDWTNYEKEQEEVDAQRLSKIRLEEEEMMTLRPITSDKTGGKMINEQDTSLPDGFLRKLALQDEKKFKKVGILSPEEGAGMFVDLGNNMFGNKEDRDLIESIQGKDSTGRDDSQGSSSNKGKGSSMVDSFSREGSDEDLLDSLKRQLGAENLADFKNIPDITDPTGEKSKTPVPTPSKKGTSAPAPSPSIFDTRAKKMDDVAREVAQTQTSKSVDVDMFETPSYGPALTTKEAEKLQDSLDDMTDNEVADVLSKLRAAVSDRIKEEVSDAMVARGISRGTTDPTGDEKKMPRAPTGDPAVREKYEKELNAIEDELEKIYSDPLGTWQEMMANPERFLEENEIGKLDGTDD